MPSGFLTSLWSGLSKLTLLIMAGGKKIKGWVGDLMEVVADGVSIIGLYGLVKMMLKRISLVWF